MKINDWSIILDEFKVTNKLIEKAKMLIIQNGIPKFYIKMLGDLEDFLVATLKDKDGIKKMKAQISKSFNTMKLTLRKHNKTYEDEIAAYRANPKEYEEFEVRKAASSDEESSDSEDESEESDEESDEEEESDEDEDDEDESSDDDIQKKPAAKYKNKFIAGGDSDSEDSMFGGDESDSDSSDDENDGELKGRAKWLKKAVDTTAADNKKAKQAAKKLSQKNAKDKDREAREMNLTSVRRAKDVQTFKVEEKMSEETLDRRVNELITSRGRKGTDAKQALYQLEVLSKIARFHGPRK
ncbi:EIF3C, partial [Symbiodinium microadriaticum]